MGLIDEVAVMLGCECFLPLLVLHLAACPRSSVDKATSRVTSANTLMEEEEEVVVVCPRENRGGAAQHATRATPTRSSHGPMRA